MEAQVYAPYGANASDDAIGFPHAPRGRELLAHLPGKKFYENKHFTHSDRCFPFYFLRTRNTDLESRSYNYCSHQSILHRGGNDTHSCRDREIDRNGNANNGAEQHPAKLSDASDSGGRRRVPSRGQG